MKALIQRVKESSVTVGDEIISEIGNGMLVLLGIEKGDGEKDIKYLAEKITNLRIFEGEDGRFDYSILDKGGEIMLVSQFTLCADCKKGRRPDFGLAAPAEDAKDLYEKAVRAFGDMGVKVKQGKFQTHMLVKLTNDGPVTILLDSKH